MKPEEFDQTLRTLLHARRFKPIVVELVSGDRIVIRKPELAFGGGHAGFIDPKSGALVGFSHEEVSAFTTKAPRSKRD